MNALNKTKNVRKEREHGILKGEFMKYCIYVEDEDERGVALVYSEITSIKDAELLASRLMIEMAEGISEFPGIKTVLIVPYFTANGIPVRRNGKEIKEIAEELHKKYRVDNIGSYHAYKFGQKKADEIREIRDCYQQIKNILEDN